MDSMVAEKKLILIYRPKLVFHKLVIPLRACHASAVHTLMSLSVEPAHAPKYLKPLTSFSTVPSIVASGRCSWGCYKLWPQFLFIYFAFSLRPALAHSNYTLVWLRKLTVFTSSKQKCFLVYPKLHLCVQVDLIGNLNKSSWMQRSNFG